MNTYQERFKHHPLQGSLTALQTAIERVRLANQSVEDGTVFAESNEVQRAAFARMFRVATFISKSVKNCDAFIWTQAAMSAAQTAVTGLTTAIEQYEASKSVAHFEVAGDTALDQFRNASISRFSTTAKNAEESFVQFCERAEAGIDGIETLSRSIKEKELEITNAREAFTNQITDLGSQLEAFKALFEAQKARVDELVTSQQQTFQTTQTERVASFTQESETRKGKFKQWSEESDETFEKMLTTAETDSAANLAEMNKHLTRASEILGIVAASAISGHYKETAERDFDSANLYRRWAFAFFVIMAGLISYVVLSINSKDFRWEMGLFRVGVGMALLIPAYYCAKESTKHREAEKRNRRLQIELATIESYLEKLNNPQEMQEILKEKANSYFMGQLPREPDDDMEVRISGKEWKRREDQFMEMVKTLGSAFKK